MNETYYEEIFAESEETTTEAVTEPPAESVTEETTIVIPDEYFMEDVTSGTELEAIFSQVSEINSYAAIIAENTTAIKVQTETQVILLFAVIAFCGMVCGLLIANCIKR